MRFGVLGTGTVGQTLGSKLIEVGHEVTMGSRQAGNEHAVAWARDAGERAGEGSFADAASSAEVVVNATAGSASRDALAVCNDDSLGEQIQRAFPEAKVVKSLNTVNAEVMGSPRLVGDSHTVFVCGNDDAAKAEVRDLLESFGWPAADIIDLGDIGAARATEMYLPLWLRLFGVTGTPRVNVRVVVGG